MHSGNTTEPFDNVHQAFEQAVAEFDAEFEDCLFYEVTEVAVEFKIEMIETSKVSLEKRK
ncbi:MAG: hypothetical protein WAV48_05025 [Candidatus Magasanikiibacteriota bacterium]